MGSFQAVPGQSACREDGLGQRSLSNGTVLPGNVPGFYAIWAVSEDEAFRRASFEMEPCVKEEACLAERCGQGSTGRQCFGVLGGFSAGASARYKCVSWQLYMAIGIAMAVLYLYLAAYTRFATVLATSEEASHQLYLMMLKMLMNHCASMSVLLSCFLRATMHGPLLESFLSLVMITDGVPPCGNEVFSLHCLLQPWRTQELRQAFDALANTSQVDYSSPTLAEARATLATFHRTTELRSLIFWASLPLVAALLLMWLRIYMARHAQHWLKAAEFSSKVHFDGLDVTCGSYPPEALQQIMAISSRRLWGLSWPLMHCNAWVHSTPPTRSMLGSFCCCLLSPILFIPRLFSKLDLLRFWTETVPLRTCLLYFFWFPAARRCFSTLHCQRLGAAAVLMPGTVMYSNGVLECDLSQPLLLLSLLAGSLWTMWPFFCWFQLYQRRSMDASFRRPYGIMLLGYNTSCWWWEVVVCLQKFLFIVIEAVPFSAVQECFLIVCVSLAAMLCHVTWRPFDHRWFDLLIRLEIKHLLVLLCSAFLCMISLQNWLLPETTVILMASLQGIYVLTLLLSFGHLKLLSTETSSLKHWEKGCLKRFLKFLLAYKRWYNDSEPYIAYDNVHRYVSVLANVGGQCTLPHLPIGRQLEAVSSVEQREVTRELLFTVAALAKDSATMSSFLLDFVVRAAFLMAADLRERHSEADELPQKVDKHAWQEANRKRDLLVIASMAEEQRQRDLLYGKATRGGPSIQKDLELEEEAISGWGLQLLQDAVAETDQSVAMTDAGHGRRPEIGEAVAVVHQKVYRMFSPTIFRRGCTLQELKASMLLLRNTPRDELQQWLDFFEKVWFLEFLDSDKEIHLMSGTRLEQGVHADAMEILKAFRRPRRVTQNALGEPVQDGMDENNIKVYLKWVRFVLYHYCGGIQAVDLGDVMRTRLSRPSRFVIQNQMEKVHEEVVVSVDEDALQRVEKGLEAALAEGLGLEPAQTALERLERGVDRALSLDESADEISL